MPTFIAHDITYATDDRDEEALVARLPAEIRFEAVDLVEATEIAADAVSDATGWLVTDLTVRPA